MLHFTASFEPFNGPNVARDSSESKIMIFLKIFTACACGTAECVCRPLTLSLSPSLFLSSLSYMPGRSAIFMAFVCKQTPQCAAQWGRGVDKAAAGACIEPFLSDLITRNLRLFLWNMVILFEVFLWYILKIVKYYEWEIVLFNR